MTTDSIPQTAPAVPAPTAPGIPETVARLRATFASGRTRSIEWRRQQLQAIARMMTENEEAVAAALEQDLGRGQFESWLADIASTVGEAKDAAKAQLPQTLDHLSKQIGDRGYLVGDSFTIADAYFVTLLNWYRFVGVDLARWPNVDTYHTRHLALPAVARAMGEEMAERKRRAA